MADYHRVHAESVAEPDAFWLEVTKELIDWETTPTIGLEGDYSGIADEQFTWYSDGRLNATISCLDRHLESRGDKTAILWEGDEPGDVREISYSQLQADVCRFSNALENLGLGSGDRVIIYMGMVP
jgi:acetyl-CoA synthetase